MGRKGGMALLVAAAWLALPAVADASMQLVSVTEPTPAKTFIALHGLNPSSERDLVTLTPSGTEVIIADQIGISSFPSNCHRLDPNSVGCPSAAYDDLSIRTGPGNDRVASTIASPNLTLKQIFGPTVSVYVNAVLGPGDDWFSGGRATDAVIGGRGRDRLVGGGGTDFLAGGAGADHLSAGPGRRDLMAAGKGRDRCIGEPRDLVSHCERVRVR